MKRKMGERFRRKGIKIMGALVLLGIGITGCSSTKEVEKENITVTIGEKEFEGLYTGVLTKKLASGEAVFSVVNENGDSLWEYEGDFAESVAAGDGTADKMPMTVEFQDKSYEGAYTGPMKDGAASGDGTFHYEEGEDRFIYEGSFDQGEMVGTGTLDISAIKLDFKDNVVRTGPYKGDIVNFLPEGQGSFSTIKEDGDAYTQEGEWKNGLFDGQGIRYYTAVDPSDSHIAYGTFKEGTHTPNYIDFLQTIGSYDDMPFSVSEKHVNFIKKHKNLFPTKKYDDIAKYVDATITYKMLDKNIDKYKGKMISTGAATIVQINENSYSNYKYTEIIVDDSQYNTYYIYYNGECNYYAGDKITVYGLAIDKAYYENLGGTTTECIVVAASHIK